MIFLCHAKEDIDHVKKLYQKLEKANYQPWLDEIYILPGQNWDYEIKQALKKATFILICLSEQSVVKRGYVNKEIKWALDRQDEMLTSDILIIPVKLTPCELPYSLESLQSVDLFQPNGFKHLQQAIDYQLNKVLPKNKVQSENISFSESSYEHQDNFKDEISQPGNSGSNQVLKNFSLSTTQKAHLVTKLLECSAMKDRDTRDAIVNELPSDIKHMINRHNSDRVDVNNIVSRCLDFNDGIATLIMIVENFEGKTVNMDQIKSLLN